MRTIPATLVAIITAALVAAGCGADSSDSGDDANVGVVDAYTFCAEFGSSVDEATWEDDGDVTCVNGEEYEGDGDLEHSGFYLRYPKGAKPSKLTPAQRSAATRKPTPKPRTSTPSMSRPRTTAPSSSSRPSSRSSTRRR